MLRESKGPSWRFLIVLVFQCIDLRKQCLRCHGVWDCEDHCSTREQGSNRGLLIQGMHLNHYTVSPVLSLNPIVGQENGALEIFPKLCHGAKDTVTIMPLGTYSPQRHDPNSCCTSSSLVWHWKHRRRLFCLDRLVSSDRSVFSSSRGRFTGEASFSDCESDQNNIFEGQSECWPGKHH